VRALHQFKASCYFVQPPHSCLAKKPPKKKTANMLFKHEKWTQILLQ